MFDNHIKISVVAAAGYGNEVLLKPRSDKKLGFAGKAKQENLRRSLTKSYEDYNAVLTENSWCVILYLANNLHNPKTVVELAGLIYSDAEECNKVASEFKYRLEWLVQIGLLDRKEDKYEISTVGEMLIQIAQNKALGDRAGTVHLVSAQRRLLSSTK